MTEQLQAHSITSPWIFYAIGYIGVIIYHGVLIIKQYGRSFAALKPYGKENGLAIVLSFFTYNAACLLWMFSDMFAGFNMFKGELNGMTVFAAIISEQFFKTTIENVPTIIGNMTMFKKRDP